MNSGPGAGGSSTGIEGTGHTPTVGGVDNAGQLKLVTTSLSDDASPSGRGFRVVIRGDVDMETAPKLAKVLEDLIEEGVSLVVLDASGVGFLDSSGLRAIVIANSKMTDFGGRLLIEGMSGAVQRVLEVSGLIEQYRRT